MVQKLKLSQVQNEFFSLFFVDNCVPIIENYKTVLIIKSESKMEVNIKLP